MKSQKEVLSNSEISIDEMPEYRFKQEDLGLLAVAEGFAYIEWTKVAEHLGLSATLTEIPKNYDTQLAIEGKWTLDYSTPNDLNRTK